VPAYSFYFHAKGWKIIDNFRTIYVLRVQRSYYVWNKQKTNAEYVPNDARDIFFENLGRKYFFWKKSPFAIYFDTGENETRLFDVLRYRRRVYFKPFGIVAEFDSKFRTAVKRKPSLRANTPPNTI